MSGTNEVRRHHMISYAQNGEDAVLRRVFGDRPSGFYIDVGAHHPRNDSITKHFYDLGWHGINIEPLPDLRPAFDSQRPRDINLSIGVAERSGSMTLHRLLDNLGLSTFEDGIAQSYRDNGHLVEDVEVEVRTLSEICSEHASTEIDFLSVDAEGFEDRVFRGGDWDRFRPRIVIGERLQSSGTSHSFDTPERDWERLLMDHGYLRTLFDGINSYFVREEDHDELAAPLSTPASTVLDNFDCYVYVDQLRSAGAQIDALRDRVAHLENELRKLTEVP